MNPIQIDNGIIIYYGNRAGRVEDGCAVVDPMFKGQELERFLERRRHIRAVKWMDGIFDRLMAAPREGGTTQALKNVRVWQLKPDVDVRMKFIGYDELCSRFGPPDKANYQTVYDGAVETNDLEALYTKFNMNHPPGYKGHSLSMSDVLELYDETGSTFHYVDRFGFKDVDFSGSQQAQAQAQTMQF